MNERPGETMFRLKHCDIILVEDQYSHDHLVVAYNRKINGYYHIDSDWIFWEGDSGYYRNVNVNMHHTLIYDTLQRNPDIILGDGDECHIILKIFSGCKVNAKITPTHLFIGTNNMFIAFYESSMHVSDTRKYRDIKMGSGGKFENDHQ